MKFGLIFLNKKGKNVTITNANGMKRVVLANKLLISAAEKLSKEEDIEIDTAYNLILSGVIDSKNYFLDSVKK